MSDKMTPEIRFKGFSDDWEQRKLGDILKVNSGRDYKHLHSGNIPVYGTGGYMLSVDDKLSQQDGIGIGRKGTIDKPQYLSAPFWTVDTLFYLTPLNNHKLKFIQQITYIINWKKYSEQTGVPSLSKNSIEKIDINVPEITEQTKISELLRTLDNTIALHLFKLEMLKKLKQGYLQVMFPENQHSIPYLRFANFSSPWEQRKLGDLATIVRGSSPRPIQDPKWFDSSSSIGWLRIADVTKQNGRIHFLEQHLSKLGQQKTRVLLEPHLLLSIAATVGKPVMNYIQTGVHDGFLIFINPTFNKEYMFQWLEMFRPMWQKYGQPGSQVNLNSELVRNQIIRIPNVNEQKNISLLISKLDNTINFHRTKIEKLQQIKKAYLQKMFI